MVSTAFDSIRSSGEGHYLSLPPACEALAMLTHNFPASLAPSPDASWWQLAQQAVQVGTPLHASHHFIEFPSGDDILHPCRLAIAQGGNNNTLIRAPLDQQSFRPRNSLLILALFLQAHAREP